MANLFKDACPNYYYFSETLFFPPTWRPEFSSTIFQLCVWFVDYFGLVYVCTVVLICCWKFRFLRVDAT